jgi:hypothetical protein
MYTLPLKYFSLVLISTRPIEVTKENLLNQLQKLPYWKYADAELKEEVEESKIPYDPTQNVLVKYVGKKGKRIK